MREPVRFNDSLDTVLAGDVSTDFGATAVWRQLVDLIARGRIEPQPRVLRQLAAIRNRVPLAARAAAARAAAAEAPPRALVGLIARDGPGVVAPVLRRARLSAGDWIALLPRLAPADRAVLRARRDLPPEVRHALAGFEASDFVLAAPEPRMAMPLTAPESARESAPQHVPGLSAEPLAERTSPVAPGHAMADAVDAADFAVIAPEPPPEFVAFGKLARELPVVAEAFSREGAAEKTGPDGAFEIADVVARLEAFRKRREEEAPEGGHAPPASSKSPRDDFDFETDSLGVIRWVEGVERAAVVGISLEYGAGSSAVFDGVARGAFRQRARIETARLEIASGAAAGTWRVTAAPWFDRASGRFQGYRGSARRPRADESAAAMPGDALRQLVHELRTPTSAIIGFAEMMEGQVLGPVPPPQRAQAADIAGQARGLLAAVEDLDVAARIEARALDLRAGRVVLAPLLARIVHDLEPLAELRGARLAISVAPEIAANGDARAIERLLGRLMSVLLASAARGETVAVDGTMGEGELTLDCACPQALAAIDFDAGPTESEGVAGAPPLGTSFALRLVRNLARELGGMLGSDGARLTLRLPARFDGVMEQAS